MKIDDEITRLRRRVREDPRSVAFVALADALRRVGRGTEALTVLRNGFRAHPDHGPARVVLARVHLDLGNRAQAEAVLDDVVAADPGNLAAGLFLARLRADDGRFDAALALADHLEAEAPGDPSIAELRTRIRAQSPNTLARDDVFDDPRLALRWAARGQTGPAQRVWARLVRRNPNHPYLTTHAVAPSAPPEPEGEASGRGAPRGAARYGALARALWRPA